MQIPKVGDTIIVTDERLVKEFGKRCIVMDFPHEAAESTKLSYIWVDSKNGTFWLERGRYEIVESSPPTSSLSSCLDCRGTGKITLLTSTVKCKCGVGCD